MYIRINIMFTYMIVSIFYANHIITYKTFMQLRSTFIYSNSKSKIEIKLFCLCS